MGKKGYIKQTIKRGTFVSLDVTDYFGDRKPYQLGVKTRSGDVYKTIACYETQDESEQAYNTLSQTIRNIIRYEKKH